MNQKTYLRLMLALTMVYGVLIAVLALLGSGGVGATAVAGGIIVGLGWALTGVLTKRSGRTS
ncbi:hypothetical protein [Nonomuraea jiangxiensis]|uniref:Uncharacterized protein n=1 Tax=Nonomuraea jiangxiensis TaxID=633440 RepID=A0A1G7YXQ6_9ACTN|nr:hypothetical protein [Nonomuraea jiangxiensis]SDH01177.1 hypothetical protein SAMN05421869_101246 [Nonomuraea jiangxiensis]